jgi:hypothetical protein
VTVAERLRRLEAQAEIAEVPGRSAAAHDGSGYQQAVLYSDSYRRVDGAWCFAEQRRHELFYGAPWLTRPNELPDTDWPRSQTGRGTVPYRWPTWQVFWADAAEEG